MHLAILLDNALMMAELLRRLATRNWLLTDVFRLALVEEATAIRRRVVEETIAIRKKRLEAR